MALLLRQRPGGAGARPARLLVDADLDRQVARTASRPVASGRVSRRAAWASSRRRSRASGALEASNVDLTAELVNLIIAQRTYQANAQTVKTQDQVMQTLVNMR